ncbi:MAG: undecaprenyl-diphosphate phosphatase [Nitrospira sp.]|nr:undecaprenyl-diphosphate phosphatase [bacterium]MBL7050256.1 undecaprenyl-diphosphate phosphatase [Nitrospira sp.]
MTSLDALIFGIIQGATEFLPVSSSGHSVLLPAIFNMTPPNLNAVAIAHLGTLMAVLIYFSRDVFSITKGTFASIRTGKLLETTESKMGWFLVIGSIPAALAGLTAKDYFESIFAAPNMSAMFLFVTAGLLVFGEFKLKGNKPLAELTVKDTIIIGLFQAMALLPGISRSGSTIAGGLLCGFNRETSARYSFLLGIPTILGAGLLSLKDLAETRNADTPIIPLIVIFFVSGVVGYACIHLLLRWLKKRSLIPFAVYCASFGAVYLLISYL